MSDVVDPATVSTPSANEVTPVSAPAVESAPAVPAAPVSQETNASAAPGNDPTPAAEPAAAALPTPEAPAAAEPTSLLGDAGKPPEVKAEEVKPVEAEPVKAEEPVAAEAPPEPIVYDLKIPETVKLSDAERAEIHGLFNEGQVKPEVAQKYLDRHYAEVQKVADAIRAEQHTVWQQTQEEWRNQVMADPEIGGNRLQTTLTSAGAMIEQYGSEELRRMLGYTGAGNHPAMVRFLNNVGKALGEGRMVPAPSPVSAAVKSRADRLYGGTSKSNGAT
jgi:hypothetical protein